MHHLIKFGYKKLSSLEDIVFTKFHDHTDPCPVSHWTWVSVVMKFCHLKKSRWQSLTPPPPLLPLPSMSNENTGAKLYFQFHIKFQI